MPAGSPHPPQAVPLPLRGEGLNAAKNERDLQCRAGHCHSRGERSVAALPGGAKPIAGWGGLEGFTPPHHYRRGQRLPADIRLPPTPRVSAGLRFAVRSLSEAKDREINKVRRLCWHFIHRGAVPLPLNRGRLKRAQKWAGLQMSSGTLPNRGERSVAALSRRGEAHRRVGWVGGVYPSASLKARTTASDGHTVYTRAARSASIGFAVRSLSKAMDREINQVRRLGWHLILKRADN